VFAGGRSARAGGGADLELAGPGFEDLDGAGDAGAGVRRQIWQVISSTRLRELAGHDAAAARSTRSTPGFRLTR
jgi:hypothetical protein